MKQVASDPQGDQTPLGGYKGQYGLIKKRVKTKHTSKNTKCQSKGTIETRRLPPNHSPK